MIAFKAQSVSRSCGARVTFSYSGIGQLLLRCLNSRIHALAMPSPCAGEKESAACQFPTAGPVTLDSPPHRDPGESTAPEGDETHLAPPQHSCLFCNRNPIRQKPALFAPKADIKSRFVRLDLAGCDVSSFFQGLRS